MVVLNNWYKNNGTIILNKGLKKFVKDSKIKIVSRKVNGTTLCEYLKSDDGFEVKTNLQAPKFPVLEEFSEGKQRIVGRDYSVVLLFDDDYKKIIRNNVFSLDDITSTKDSKPIYRGENKIMLIKTDYLNKFNDNPIVAIPGYSKDESGELVPTIRITKENKVNPKNLGIEQRVFEYGKVPITNIKKGPKKTRIYLHQSSVNVFKDDYEHFLVQDGKKSVYLFPVHLEIGIDNLLK